ncbi:MAG: hypothetical protein ACREJG_12075 [Candidatus Rokuibacteriota bacterium]
MTFHANRYLFIVSRDTAAAAAYLRQYFDAESEVEIIVDRRRRTRRSDVSREVMTERRIGERRTRPSLDAELRLAPYVFLTLSGTPSPRSDDHEPNSLPARDRGHADVGGACDRARR